MKESLAVKYRPKTWSEVTEQSSVRTILEQQITSGNICHSLLFIGSAGCGKAQPLYSKLLTPRGYITMGDVRVGDELFTRFGERTHVTAIYPQGVRPIYEMTLQDGTRLHIADNHLNSVYRYNQNKKCREDFVLSTLDLIDFLKTSKWKLRVDVPSVDWEHTDVLINPYLLGALLGDGSLASGNFGFSNAESDVVKNVDAILQSDYNMQLRHIGRHDYRISYIERSGHNGSRGDRGLHELVRNYDVLSTLRGQLSKYGLLCKSTEKYIPTEYLYNDKQTRLALLQGLFDTDGYIAKNGGVTFTTSSKQLSDDFAFLVRSLGIRDTVKVSKSKYKNKQGSIVTCSLAYTHFLHVPNDMVFYTSMKHANRRTIRQNDPLRNIVSVKYVGDEICQCIMVDNYDHTYISDDFIPTHNTTCARIYANEVNQGKGNPIELDAASNNGVDDVRSIIAQAQTKSLDSEYKVFVIDECHALSSQGWQAFLKLIEEPPAKSIFIFCTTNPEKIPKTILSRVQQYTFKKISQQGIVDRLRYVLQQEDAGTETIYPNARATVSQIHLSEALEYIARISEGGLRDALTLLDKCLSYSPELTLENVVSVLGTVDYDTMISLTDNYLADDSKEVVKIINSVNDDGKDMKQFLKSYTYFLMDVIKYLKGCDWKYLTIPKLSTYESFFSQIEDNEYDLLFNLMKACVKLNSEVKYSAVPRLDIEAMFLIQMGN